MRRINFVRSGIILLILSSGLQAQTPASFRVLLGVTDAAPTRWDGTIRVSQAGRYTLEGWRFDGDDYIDGTVFYLSTHPPHLLDEAAPVAANGFILSADAVTAKSVFAFTTAQGDFSFTASEVPYARGTYKLGGRVYIDRVPLARRITDTPEEEDYPSLAVGGHGEIWLAYVQFHHSPDHLRLRVTPHQPPQDFSELQEPTGGDQIWARKFSEGSWGEPIAITPAGGDLYRAAVAVDRNGRAWIFWSENRRGNFDIFARAVEGSGPQEPVQISTEAGSDIDPVAATDASGRVWVAWQGWREGRAAIFAAHQAGDAFSTPVKVSNSSKNEWNPAIAADKTGRVAVAWDSYRNGNYDVYARTYSGDAWGQEIPVAATARYEAYPSIAFDPRGCLWIAYEEGGKGWGKDFGSYSTRGIALYQGRAIRLRGLDPDGRLVTLDAPLDSKLVGVPAIHADRTGSQSDSESLDPIPTYSQTRPHDMAADDMAYLRRVSKNSMPRLAVDGSGRFWLAFRTPHPIWWNPIGSVWTEYLLSFDGKVWTNPIFLNHTDNLLDNRPALAPISYGKLLIVNSSDGRRNFQISGQAAYQDGSEHPVNSPGDPYNNDLWSQKIDLGPANQIIPVVAAGGGERPEAPTINVADAAGIKAMREYRGGPEANLRIARGEFHRHSEISMDGRDDGTILDQWRYILDAADLDWIGCCDHDNGGGREYSWWITQKQTDIFLTPGKFVPMFSYERSVSYPEGHRNVIFVQRGIRPLPRLPLSAVGVAGPAPDTEMLYAYVKQFHGIVASHTSATSMGTDWRDNDPDLEPAVEIYQGIRQSYEMPGAPRSNSEKDAIGGWRPKGYVSEALSKGLRLGFEASSDHDSTHISYSNLYVKDLTRESVLEALQKRHVYAATDNILADVECGDHMMGDEFTTSEPPTLKIKLRGTSRFAKVIIIRDGKFVFSASPHKQNVEFSWRDNQPQKDKTSYYYVRGEQDNGEIIWVSPLWVRYTGN